MFHTKNSKPKKGDLIYIDTSLYIDHGRDDFRGGLCEISDVRCDPQIMVSVMERPGTRYGWEYLSQQQEKLKKTFGERRGYCDPDPVEMSLLNIRGKSIDISINELRFVLASVPEETRQKLCGLINIYKATQRDARVLFQSNLFPLLMGISSKFDTIIEEVMKLRGMP